MPDSTQGVRPYDQQNKPDRKVRPYFAARSQAAAAPSHDLVIAQNRGP